MQFNPNLLQFLMTEEAFKQTTVLWFLRFSRLNMAILQMIPWLLGIHLGTSIKFTTSPGGNPP